MVIKPIQKTTIGSPREKKPRLPPPPPPPPTAVVVVVVVGCGMVQAGDGLILSPLPPPLFYKKGARGVARNKEKKLPLTKKRKKRATDESNK